MAQVIGCDFCQEEAAVVIQTTVDTGDTTGIGAACLPMATFHMWQAAGAWAPPATEDSSAPAAEPAAGQHEQQEEEQGNGGQPAGTKRAKRTPVQPG